MNITDVAFIVFLLFAVIYAVSLIFVLYYWSQLKEYHIPDLDLIPENAPFISVVIAVRNESSNIEALIEGLKDQDLPKNRFEAIIVNDHSTDDTANKLSGFEKAHPWVRQLDLRGGVSGKKRALEAGIAASKGEVIAVTDADCELPITWLRSHLSLYVNSNCSFVAGAVTTSSEDGFLTSFQQQEMISIMGITGALFAKRSPMMCNGANMSFLKSVYNKVGGYKGHIHMPSGDDVYLLQKFQKQVPGQVKFIKSSHAVVRTKPVKLCSDFIHQKLRWASKWKYGEGMSSMFLAVIIFLFHLLQIVTGITLFFDMSHLEIWTTAMCLRLMAEWMLIREVSLDLQQNFKFMAFLGSFILYPFYTIFFGIFANLKKGYKWKDRKLKIVNND